MQAEEARHAALRIEAYRLVSLGDPIPHKIESITTYRTLVFVGTSDSKVAVYRVEACKESAAPLMLLQEITESRRHAVRQLTVVGKCRLLALVGDVLVVYHIHDDTSHSASGFQLRAVTTITGHKDTIAFHVKQQKGVISMAVLQRKRVTLYEASPTNLDFLLKVTVALPDGVKTLSWMGRSIIFGGRKEYLLYNTTTASTSVLYPTPRSGAAPLVLPMAPVPEVLVASDGAGLRTLLYDGSEVPGDSRIRWATPPAEVRYEHPYVVSHHPSAPHHALQIRLPMLATLEDATAYPRSCLCQTIDLPKVVKVAQCHWIDYDCAMPSRSAPPDVLSYSPIVLADSDHRLHLLVRTSVAVQAEALAAAKLFAAADLLCRLCPHEVAPPTLQRIVMAGALDKFVAQQDYAGCFHDFSTIESDPRVAIQLFPGFLRLDETPSSCPALPAEAPATIVVAALPALADYLHSQRATLVLLSGSASAEPVQSQLRAVDRALVMSLCALKREEALMALLRGEIACDVADAAAILREHRQWVALTLLLEAHGQYDEAVSQLHHLVSTSEERTEIPQPQLGALQELFRRHPFPAAKGDDYVAQSTLWEWLTSCPSAHSLSTEDTAATCTTATAMMTALNFFRRRPLTQFHRLLEQHSSWVFGVVPAESAVRVFFSEENVHHYGVALQVLQAYPEAPCTTPRLLLVVEYLFQLLADVRVRVTEPVIYERYWRGLGELLFASPVKTVMETEKRQRLRDRLHEFLLTSPHVNLESATAYFNAADIRSRCLPERAVVHRRQGNHQAAISMFLNESKCLADATAYARSVYADGSSDAFTALLEALLRPTAGAPRVTEALEVMNTCDGIDAAAVLPMLPDEMAFSQVSSFLLHALRANTTACRASAVYNSILQAKRLQSEESCIRLSSRAVVLEEGMVCPVCQRRLRPDTVLAVYPNNVMLHQGCALDEHVCAATLHDYRHDAYATLEDL
ncbi:putative CNH domain/Vacuolar sorting protein 39 domain 1/Vacuolar sorting protein 39 domain 2 [Leishmania shawi]|uniref:CNH domain/Vacuolar sorting protein 39 domain 1/Vacuolar sorting protein 39 domain 2 n=1 Tax=Leishmania shawi TaxID=5680 RepID=A0AAW3BZZ7_9TRYP